MEIDDFSTKKIWKKAITLIRESGDRFMDNDGRVCIEVTNLILKIKNAEATDIEGPIDLVSSQKKWIYPSKDELAGIMFKSFQNPAYEYTYGGRIFSFNEEVDQINDFILPLLSKDPHSRRAILVLYDPSKDSDVENKNTPGIIYIQFRILEGKLNVSCHIRSNDLFFGWPANIYQVYCLQGYVAEKLKLIKGDLVTISNSAHIFEEDVEYIDELLRMIHD
ncbi:hypothetical protein COV13_00420 [Candidatus Woesearchaeota archaeon CG10_big_fil_rev_8_21_14_0_10_32_9]|nr:MAG: hypothetical protein COV13_00420 [Candidatus Woesearchaeota archaeon CG10_big_fil_rev_8_21_14_0_10_32_9]